jgi:two-component system, OmpR family, sensor histidine kinase BaeS
MQSLRQQIFRSMVAMTIICACLIVIAQVGFAYYAIIYRYMPKIAEMYGTAAIKYYQSPVLEHSFVYEMDYMSKLVSEFAEAPVITDAQGNILYAKNMNLTYVDLAFESRKIPVEVEKNKTIYIIPPDYSLNNYKYVKQVVYERTLACIGFGIVAVFLTSLLSNSLAKRIADPIQVLTANAPQMSTSDVQVSGLLKFDAPEEVLKLATSLDQMRQEVRRQIELRRQMTADIAHELRTPMSVISAKIESLRDGVINPLPHHFQLMYEEVMLMNRLVDDLRTISLIDANALVLYKSTVDIGTLVDHVVKMHTDYAKAQQVTITITHAAQPIELMIDTTRIIQLLSNVIENAIRHSKPQQTVAFTYALDGANCVIQCIDQGSGIAQHEVDLVFQRFYRADNSIGNGSGLGLAIAQSIAVAHGGAITVQSELDQGTTVTLKLPFTT